MMTTQTERERLCFACTGCGNTWTGDYDVAHVEDGYGHVQDYYSCDGINCVNPTAPGVLSCPACGRSRILVTVTPEFYRSARHTPPVGKPAGAGRVAA